MHKNFTHILCIVSMFSAASAHGAEGLDAYLRAQYAAMEEAMKRANEQARRNGSQRRPVDPNRISLPCGPDPIVTAFHSIQQEKATQAQEK